MYTNHTSRKKHPLWAHTCCNMWEWGPGSAPLGWRMSSSNAAYIGGGGPKREQGFPPHLGFPISEETIIQSRPVQALYWTWPGLLWSQWLGIFVHSCNNCFRSFQNSAPDESSRMSHQAQTSGSFSNNCCRSEQIFQVIDSKAGQARSSTGLVLAWTEYLFCLAPLKGAAAEHQLISSLVSLSIVKICKKITQIV